MKRERLEELVKDCAGPRGTFTRGNIFEVILAVERETVERVVAGIDANPKPFTTAGICERELAKNVARSLLTEK